MLLACGTANELSPERDSNAQKKEIRSFHYRVVSIATRIISVGCSLF